MQKYVQLRTRFSHRPVTNKRIYFFVPNFATILSLCLGLSGVRFALQGQYQFAVAAILIAGIFDMLDGRLARFFGTSTRFGAELDSLVDFVSFGISPALVLYLRLLQDIHGWGWSGVLFFSICAALRLARFNTHDIQGTLPTRGFFIGVPITIAAFLMLTPLILSFTVSWEIFLNPWLNLTTMVIVGGLMISQIPTFSPKKIKVSRQMLMPMLFVVALVTASLFNEPWLTIAAFNILYAIGIPLSCYFYSFKS